MVLLYTTLAALSWSALAYAQVPGVGGGAPAEAGAGAATTTAAAAGASSSASTGTGEGMYPPELEGTWSTKSNRTHTGPGFYDPLNEKMIEPSHTGISYSFTLDGHYEEAYYRAVANPTNPKCPSGLMQWQHGKWHMNSTGSLILQPIAVDGRQLMSSPCQFDNSIFTRYNQSETFQRFSVYTDPYHNIPRLDLFQFNGAPLQPLYLAFKPPQMLPTTTLNPTNTAAASATSSSKSKQKRGLDAEVPVNWKMNMGDGTDEVVTHINTERLWWIGLSMTGLGGLLYLGPRRMGVHL